MALNRRPVTRMFRVGPGRGVGGLDGGVRLVGLGSGAAVRLERHDVGQAGLAQRVVPVVAGGVGAVGDHGPAGEARLLGPGREGGGQLRLGAEGRIGPAVNMLPDLLLNEPAIITNGAHLSDGSWEREVTRSVWQYRHVRTVEDYIAKTIEILTAGAANPE